MDDNLSSDFNMAKLLGASSIPDGARDYLYSKELCDKDFNDAIEFAINATNDPGDMYFTLMVSGFDMKNRKDGKGIFMVPNFPPDENKIEKTKAYTELGRAIAQESIVFPYIIISMMDAWCLAADTDEKKEKYEELGSIQDHPDRDEAVVILGLTFMGEYYCAVIRYKRDEDGNRVATKESVDVVNTDDDDYGFTDNVLKFLLYGWLRGLVEDSEVADGIEKVIMKKRSRLN